MNPTKIAFEKMYSDKSGVELAVSYDETKVGYEIQFNRNEFDIQDIRWLIHALTSIQVAVK